VDIAEVRALLEGYRATGMLHAAAKLGLADRLVDGPARADVLAAACEAEPGALRRLLRGLTLIGFCNEREDGAFALAELGQHMRVGAPGALHEYAILCGGDYMPAWSELPHSIATCEPGYQHHFGADPWTRRAANPALGAAFDNWLAEATAGVSEEIARAYHFGEFASVADIAGGTGALLSAILAAHPGTRGILFEREAVAERARAALAHVERCTVEGGDFFHSIGVRADLIVMKSILHDWPDEACGAILGNCRATGARLLIVERVLPARAEEDRFATMLDLHMMVVTGGRERSLSEYHALLARAGYAPGSVTPTPSGFHLIEGVPA